MNLEDLYPLYDKMQLQYGDPSLHSIYHGGCKERPDFFFVFMNPTGKNLASLPGWDGIYAPWIGTKMIWDLFYRVDLLSEEIYLEIKRRKGKEWDPAFARRVYQDIEKHKVFVSNLGKCTQIDARPLKDSVFLEYRELLLKEIEIVKPRIVLLFGNQVSSILLNQKISVSTSRRVKYQIKQQGVLYETYSIFYPVGNGRFNLDKAIEDILWIKDSIKVA